MMSLKEKIRRGQAMVLYALLMPVLIIAVGVGVDLGWYYLTVSRLQNAADAAVLAGALKLVEENQDLSDYYVYSLTDQPTSDFQKDYKLYYIEEESKHYSDKTINETPGKEDARKYANKNLSSTEETGSVKDNWNTIKGNEGVTFSSELYARKMDIDREENGIKYYKVTLIEKVSHLFLRGLDPMEAKVVAYAMLKPHDTDLVTTINHLEKREIIGNWMYQKAHKDSYLGNWNHYRQSISGSDGQKNIAYNSGDAFRTETVNVEIKEGANSNNTSTSSGQKTEANGGNYYSEEKVDSLNIDFNQDVRFGDKFTTKDWDLRATDLSGIPTITYRGMAGWSTTHGYDLRIQGLINFNDAWTNRHLLDQDTTNDTYEPDILWTRIEGDPIWSDSRSNNERSLNSVHQMIINVHADNTETQIVKDADGNAQLVYKYRPFFVFYMGPEVNDKQSLIDNVDKTFTENTAVRKSQPVILNLYADWNAIIYVPNSPIIINGNGHKLTGFVIAKEYLLAAEAKDYTDKGYVEATDDYKNKIYIKKSDTLTEAQFNAMVAENKYSVDVTAYPGYKILYEEIEAPHYAIISVSKEDAKTYSNFTEYVNATYKENFKAYSGLSDEEITSVTFPQEENNGEETYWVATADLSDSQKNGYVKVLAKVTVDGEETNVEKYIAKANLPYVKIRRNKSRPYVSVYDLKKKKAGSFNTGTYAGVTITDDSISATGSSTDADHWDKDGRSVVKNLLENTYDKEYIDSKLNFPDDTEGLKYFIIKSEIVNEPQFIDEYRKIIFKDEIRYVSENKKTYYMEIVPNGSSGKDGSENGGKDVENKIIIDNKGDLQVKQLEKDSSFSLIEKIDKEGYPLKPDDEEMNKKIHNMESGELQNYRKKEDEVVYKKSTFNLKEMTEPPLKDRTKEKLLEKYPGEENAEEGNTEEEVTEEEATNREKLKQWQKIMKMDSYYSYFLIPSLHRTVYQYMNVNELKGTVNEKPGIVFVEDMFFTTKRASWID